MAKFELNMGEEKLLESFGWISHDGKNFTTPGSVVLTNQRVVFLKRNPLFMHFGAVGALLMLFVPPKFGEEFKLDQVVGYSHEKLRFKQRAMSLDLMGGKSVRLNMDKLDAFTTALRGALERMGRVGTDSPEGGWKVR